METPEFDQTQPIVIDKVSAKSLMPQLYFGTLYMLGFLGVLYTVFVTDLQMSDTQEKIAMILIGILSSGMMQIMGFLFGSSAGSKAKDK